ncbi:hypothetical protein BGZ82_001869 [Podila clonocystis]|nr:hypothetical protein BGZ82_001869 [Podila clonocystis]
MAPTDTKTRSQQIPRRPSGHSHLRHHHHNNESPYQPSPLIQQHQPFPSSTSSFSIRNSTLSSSASLLGPNDSGTTPRPGSQGSASHFASNNNISNANSHYNFIQPTNYERRAVRSYSFGEGSLPRPNTGSGGNGSARTGTGFLGNGNNNPNHNLMRPRAATVHEPLLQQRDSNSDLNSLYTIDHSHTPYHTVDSEDDDMSYFGSAGQDYLLKKRRARMARRFCAADMVALVAFTALVALVEVEGGGWRWEWSLIPWPLAGMAMVRVAALAFTARYSHGNYNVGVIFVCGLITLYTLFEINMVIQHHIQVAAVVVVQYIFTILMTQLHWISYSAHTPMSATLAYAYDPIMSDSITFSRESRYMGTFSGGGGQNGRQSSLRRGTSYGTMNGSPFDAVQEMDEGNEDDDDNAFIKVNVDLAASRKKHFGQYRRRVSGSQSSLSDGADDGNNNKNNRAQENEDEEEDQDMAVLLAFQDARRQQVYAFSPTALSSVLPARSILSSQAGGVAGLSSSPLSSSGQLNKTPLSWAFRPQDSHSSSYDMRTAAAGGGSGSGGVGGLTVGYTPRKRMTRRSNFDPNGAGRRTWTGGHSIIYSGILLESSDDEAGVDDGLGNEGGQEGDVEDEDVATRDSFAEEDEGGDEFRINDDAHVDKDQTIEYTQTTETTEATQTTETTTTTRETTVASHETTVVDGSDHLSNGRGRGVSTIKVKKSSNKQITAVLCEDPNCKEHPHQGGPPPDIDLGPDFPQDLDRTKIVDLDIKESSTESVERIGPNVGGDYDSDNGEVVPSGRIVRRPELGAIDLDGSLDLDKIIGSRPHDGEHGSREVHVRQRIEKTTIVETEEVPCEAGSNELMVAVDPNALTKLVPAPLSPPNEPGDQDQIHMEGGRRVHIRQRTERITIKEQDELGGPAIIGGAIVGGAIVMDNQPGLIVGPTVSTTISPEQPMPGGWVGIQGQPGVVTWGYATDVDQPTTIVEPTMYISPQRPVIVGQGPTMQTVEPIMVIEKPPPVAIPPRVFVPPPQPVIAPPPPRIMAPPPRMIQPAPQPMIQPRPGPTTASSNDPTRMIQQPVPRAIVPAPVPIIPAPMPVVQPAPQYVAPIPAPAMVMPRPMAVAPSEYAYYDDVGTVGIGGYGAYSAASIYENDIGNRSIVSIYDDRSVASVYEYENQPGASYGPGYGPGYGAGGFGAEYGPGYGPGYGRHMSAAHIGRKNSPGPRERREDGEMFIENRHVPRQKSPPQGNYINHLDTIPRQQSPSQRVLDQQRFYHESAAYNENRHEPTRQLSPRYLERAERFERGADVYLDNHHAQGQMSPRRIDRPERQTYFQAEQHQRPRNPQSGAEETLEYIANRHVSRSAATQNREPGEESYREMELGRGIGQVQELALETYYDTTKSQLKVREQQGNALAEKVFQLQYRSHEPATPPPVTENIALEPPMRPLPNQPPTFSIPKPPVNPPPVRLLVNRGVGSSPKPSSSSVQALHHKSSFPKRYSPNGIKQKRGSEEEENDTPILSTLSSKNETIMLQARHQPKTEPSAPTVLLSATVVDDSALAVKARPMIFGALATSPEAASSVESTARHQPPVTAGAKKRRKEHFPAMSRNHLHPSTLNEGIWACWNNEFGTALEIFKEHAATYPRWCLATAEVHIVRQLISGQLSEPDLDLTDALLLSEKISSRVLDKKQEFDSSYMGYRSLCAADASLITANDNTLRQNYKWDCEMAFYDTLLYRGILQLTSASDTKGTFTDIKGGLQLRRAWKGYMRIKQEMELAKEKWQRLSALNTAASSSTPSQSDDKENTPPQGAKPPLRSKTALAAVAAPISIPTSKRASLQASSQPSEGSRWSIFGRRASLSSSPPVEGSNPLAESGLSRSRFLSTQLGGGGPAKGLASSLRDQAKAVEEFKNAVKVLEDTEDYLQYGIGLFYFIVSIVPKSLVPALRTIGLQSNHEQGIKNFEDVLSRKNGRAPFAALFLLINYLFLPRGVADPSASLGRAGVILNEALRRCPNGSSYLLMACHHARKTGNMIPSAMNHITRGIQTCEAAGIPSINYRFELGLTFFIHQEFGKAADIFEILWRKYINQDIEVARGHGGRRKGRSQSLGQPGQTSALPITGAVEEDEEDDFELAPFCGLCLIASKVVVRLGQEGYFEYGREGFGRNAAGGANSAGGSPSSMEGVSSSNNFGHVGPDFDLLMAAQEVISMMSPPSVETLSSPSPPQPLAKASTLIFEHVKAGSSQSIKYVRDLAQSASTDSTGGRDPLLAPAPLNRFNKFAWNQCQKSLQKGRISLFLPLVILYLRRDLAYMKPVLLRKYRTLLESIWKTVSQPVDADTQAIYLLLSAVVHRQLLPDDATFSYTALTDCLLLESMIESEMWVVPYCHYELGELLFKKLQLPQAAIEQFQWILRGPGKEVRPSSVYVSTLSASTSNPRLSVFGGGFPSDTVTQLVESASHVQETGNGDSHHTQHLSGSSQYRLSQFFPGAPTSQTPTLTSPNPPNPLSFYNSRYKKFEFSQVLRQRSSICVEQIQKAIEESNERGGGSASTSSSRAGTMKYDVGMDVASTSCQGSLLAKDVVASKKLEPEPQAQHDHPMLSDKITEAVDEPMDLEPSSDHFGTVVTPDPDVEMTDAATASNGGAASSSTGLHCSQKMPSKTSPLEQDRADTIPPGNMTTQSHEPEPPRSPTAYQAHFQNLKGWSASTLPNILTDAQRRRGSQQWLPGGASIPGGGKAPSGSTTNANMKSK